MAKDGHGLLWVGLIQAVLGDFSHSLQAEPC